MNNAIISPPAHVLLVCDEHMLSAFYHEHGKLTGQGQFQVKYY